MIVECDYDWKDADSTEATGRVEITEITSDDGAEALLLAFDKDVREEFSSRAYSLVPRTVNSEKVATNGSPIPNPGDHRFPFVHWITASCIRHLRAHPGVRKFEIEGNME